MVLQLKFDEWVGGEMNTRDSVKSQYHASLEMLQLAVHKCPDSLWGDLAFKNAYWRVAYHALWATHFYLQPTVESFVPWTKHRDEANLGPEPAGEPYSKEEILEYLQACQEQVEVQVDSQDPGAPSGFSWMHCSRLELQIYNIRHLQQHIGELCEGLGSKGATQIGWVLRPGMIG